MEMKVLHLSTHLLSFCSQSPAFMGQQVNDDAINKVWSEKTLLLLHFGAFDVPVSAPSDLDIISCPSSKRLQTRCFIQNQITGWTRMCFIWICMWVPLYCICSLTALKFTQTYFFLMKSCKLTEMIIMFTESAFFI